MGNDTGWMRGRWHRASSGRRVATVFAALLVATAVVTTLGVGTQPVYPEWSEGDQLLGDLRIAPEGELWSTDLAAIHGTPLPEGCRGMRPVGEIGGDAVIVSSATAYDGCDGSVALLARVDPATGEARWVVDLASRLGESGLYMNMFRDDEGPLATVVGQSAPSSRAVRVDLDSGAVLADVIGADDEAGPAQQMSGIASGRMLVALQPRDRVSDGGLDLEYSDGETTPYRLVDVDDPDTAIWSGDVGTSDTPLLLGSYLVVESTDGPVVIDAASGDQHPVPGGAATIEDAGVSSDLLVATVTTRAGEREAMALDRSGALVWSTPLELTETVTVTDDCIVLDQAPATLECLSADDGASRWKRVLDLDDDYAARVDAYQQVVGGGTIVVNAGSAEAGAADLEGQNPTTLLGLSPATGETTFSAEVPALSYLAGLARTVGFSNAYVGQDFSQTMVTAFDLSDGRRLWQQRSPSRGTLDFWAGALVSVDADGVAHGLRTQADVVPPTADAATSPLG